MLLDREASAVPAQGRLPCARLSRGALALRLRRRPLTWLPLTSCPPPTCALPGQPEACCPDGALLFPTCDL